MKIIMGILMTGLVMSGTAMADTNRVDGQRPDAPELAAPGPNAVGVRTLNLVNKGQIDIVNVKDGKKPMYDRPLTVEVWYPSDGATKGGAYKNVFLRDGKTQVTLHGQAARDAAPAKADNPYPLIIISHGYPGNRFLMSHFGENLASKGYVVRTAPMTTKSLSAAPWSTGLSISFLF
jgi:hypothetical protein